VLHHLQQHWPGLLHGDPLYLAHFRHAERRHLASIGGREKVALGLGGRGQWVLQICAISLVCRAAEARPLSVCEDAASMSERDDALGADPPPDEGADERGDASALSPFAIGRFSIHRRLT